MHVGFHDDPNFRYEERRTEMLDQARAANTTIVRTLVTWANVAPTRPANAANPFDKAYRFNDLDELVRNTQERDMEVLITIWGTPKWANGGKTPNFMPTRLSDLTAFSRAVASRYSGRFSGYPFVRFYSIWNESNLQLFLAPQFDAKGKSVAPRNYAKLAAAGVLGDQGRQPSGQGRDRQHVVGRSRQAARRQVRDAFAGPLRAARRSCQPAPEVRCVGAASVSGTGQPEAEPEGALAECDARVVRALREVARHVVQAEERPHLDHRVRARGEVGRRAEGVSRAQQAAYAAQALALAKADPRTDMFIWFVFRDHTTSLWQSGLRTKSGAAKPSLARFTTAARSLDARNAIVNVRGGVANPTVTVPLRAYAAGTKPGEIVGFNVTVREKGKLVASGQPTAAFRRDATRARPRVRLPAGEGQDVHGRDRGERLQRRRREAGAHADSDRDLTTARPPVGLGPGRGPGPTAHAPTIQP